MYYDAWNKSQKYVRPSVETILGYSQYKIMIWYIGSFFTWPKLHRKDHSLPVCKLGCQTSKIFNNIPCSLDLQTTIKFQSWCQLGKNSTNLLLNLYPIKILKRFPQTKCVSFLRSERQLIPLKYIRDSVSQFTFLCYSPNYS